MLEKIKNYIDFLERKLKESLDVDSFNFTDDLSLGMKCGEELERQQVIKELRELVRQEER